MLELGLIAVFAFVAFVVWRSLEQFRLAYRDGKLLVVRGALPQGLLNDFADTLRRAGVKRAALVGRKQDGGLRLTASGVSEWDLQRLRNQLGHHPYGRLSAPSSRAARRTLGTMLNISWLAWLLARPDDFN